MKTHLNITYQGKPLVDGTIVRFRNGRHSDEPSPIWQPYQEGIVSGCYFREKPIRKEPTGLNFFAIAGADIEFRHDTWSNEFRSYDGEEFIVEIPGLNVTKITTP